MNLDSNIVKRTIQSLLTDVTPKVLTSPDISNAVLLTDDVQVLKREYKVSEKKRDPVTDLFEKMNAANVEFNTQVNSGCLKFQESVIDVQSQVPLSDKYLSREMREFIKNFEKNPIIRM